MVFVQRETLLCETMGPGVLAGLRRTAFLLSVRANSDGVCQELDRSGRGDRRHEQGEEEVGTINDDGLRHTGASDARDESADKDKTPTYRLRNL
jgi:hypothetical protein